MTGRIAAISLLLFVSLMPVAAQTIPVVKLTGETIVAIRDGDLVHPAFSPDGTSIAYSRVVIRNKMELCEVVVRTLPNGRPRTLLTSQQSRKYAMYGAFVVSLYWTSKNRLTAWIVDGDVDSTGVTFDVRTGRIVKTENSGLADVGSVIDPSLRNGAATMSEIEPKLPSEVIGAALQRGNGAFLAGPERIVFKHEYSQYPDDIQIADLSKKRFDVILKIASGPPPFPHLLGGFQFGRDIYFAVTADSAAKLYRYDGAYSKEIWRTPITEQNGAPSLSVVSATDKRVIFAVEPLETTSRFASNLFVVDAKGIRRIEVPSGTIETVVQADRIAICYRVNNVRNIAVRKFELE